MSIVYYAIVAVAAYLIGGVSIANVLSKKLIGKKINEVGSGNMGASNMIRNCGWGAGIATLAFDAAKAVLILWLAERFLSDAAPYAMYVAAVSVIIGHIWPIWAGFNGGKGVACSLGVMLYLMPWMSLIVLGICVIITLVIKTMSITSFTGLVLMLIAAYVFHFSEPEVWITVTIIFIIILITHRENIGRLIRGEEAKVKIKPDDE